MDEFDKELEAQARGEKDAFDEALESQPEEQGFLSKLGDKAKAAGNFVLDNAEAIGNPLGEVAMDFGKGGAEGLTLGSADEMGGAIGAGMEKLLSYVPGTSAHNTKQVDEQLKSQGFQLPEESLADTYQSYQKGVEQDFNEASERSPYMNLAGNIAGSVASGVAAGKILGIGEKATQGGKKAYDMWKDGDKLKAGLEVLKNGGKNYLKAMPAIAAESALNSEENLVGKDANPAALGEDVLGGLAFGVPAVLGMQGISDLAAPAAKDGVQKAVQSFDEFADENPFVRKAKKAFEYGEQGINPVAQKHLSKLEVKGEDATENLVQQIRAADKKLGTEVGDSLAKAEAAGQLVDLEAPVNKALAYLNFSYQNMEDIADNSRGKEIFSKITNNMKQVKPTEAKALLDDIDAFIGKFNAIGLDKRTQTDNNVLKGLMKTREELRNTLKDQVEGYRLATERFADFRSNVPETILGGETPDSINNIFMGNLRDPDKKLFKNLNVLTTESTAQGSSAEKARIAMERTMGGMKRFEANELARKTQSPLPFTADEFGKTVSNLSDERQLLRDMQTVKSPSFNNNVLAATAQLGKEGALRGANIAGRVSKPLTDLSKKVYNMPAEKLTQYADLMEKTPGLSMYGKALKEGLQNGDQAKKNAALFSIMQNPSARLIFNSNNEEEN